MEAEPEPKEDLSSEASAKEETVHISLDREEKKNDLSPDQKALVDQILADYRALPKADHYKVLHVAQDANGEQIHEAYKDLVRRFHPDRLPIQSFSGDVVGQANEILARATQASKTLSNTEQRKIYDRELGSEDDGDKRSVQMILAAENEFNSGVSAVKHQAWEAAKRHFTKAVELFPEEGEYHAHLGWSIYNLTDQPMGERTRQARVLLEKAIRMNPRSDRSYYFLGMLLKDNNLIEKAALMFAQAYRFNKTNTEAKNQLKAIQSVRSRTRPPVKGRRGRKAPGSAKDLFEADISFDTVKKAILKIFW